MHLTGNIAFRCLRVATICAVLLTGLPAASLAQQPTDFSQLAKEQVPAVVAILTRQQVELQELFPESPFGDMLRRYYGAPDDARQERTALGSGFLISAEGYIVTANHVIENATDIHVKFSNSKTANAELVGADPMTDIAVLKVDPPEGVGVAQWGDSQAMEPGNWVVAIGSPFGLGGTVTVGVLSAHSRNVLTGEPGGLLQTDASINQGNSGGPLFNAGGKVIGVNTAIVSPSGGNVGVGFAVPSATARAVVQQLIETGEVVRGYIGAHVQGMTPELAEALNVHEPNGALIASVQEGSPAEKAGIEPGDVITRVGKQPIEGAQDLVDVISHRKPGASVEITALRNGQEKTFTVTLGERPSGNGQAQTEQEGGGQEQAGDRLGVAVAPVEGTTEAGRDVGGLVVQRVAPGSPADESGIQSGDVIVSANGKAMRQPQDLAQAWQTSRQSDKPVLLRVYRDGNYTYLAIG